MDSNIQVRVDDELIEIKRNTSNPHEALTKDEMLQKLTVSRMHAEQGLVRDADDVIVDMRMKYGFSDVVIAKCNPESKFFREII